MLLLLSYAFVGGSWLSAQAAAGSGRAAAGDGPPPPPLLRPLERAYLLGLVPLEVYCTWAHPVLLRGALPFLPLMLTSLYCSLGMVYLWLACMLPATVGAPTGKALSECPPAQARRRVKGAGRWPGRAL